jgi:pyridoxamine 5'-phosphate oxidase
VPEAEDPIARFHALLERARAASPFDPTAAALATVDARGSPSVRIVLVKAFDARGFVFHTNRESRKARELAANPRAALAFHWAAIGEQVRAEGEVSPLGDAESDAYFATRPRASRIGAWASRQSAPLASREELESAVREIEARFAGREVPRPPFWGGYVLAPARIEFWTSEESRLHRRTLFFRDGDRWRTSLLYP